MNKVGNIFGGSLLVAGTCIGGGMLVLPVVTGIGGFFPSIIIDLFTWLFMLSTGLLFVELCLGMKGEANIVSIAIKTLGLPGRVIVWILYLFLFYCLTTGYIAGGGDLVVSIFSCSKWLGTIIFTLLFGSLVYSGAWFVDRVNIVLMVSLIVSFLLFVFVGIPYVNTQRLFFCDWHYSLFGVGIVFTSFAFQGLVPSLCVYMRRNVNALRWTIIIGSGIPFVVYTLWQWLILGIIPVHGKFSLTETLLNGSNVVIPLRSIIVNSGVYVTGQFFAFFAIVTSFLGVTLGLLDFLADGLKIKKTYSGRFLLCLLIYVPTVLFAISNSYVFFNALKYAGAFGVAILLGLLPILMTWIVRYHKKTQSSYQLPGGKPILCMLAIFALLEIIMALLQITGLNMFQILKRC